MGRMPGSTTRAMAANSFASSIGESNLIPISARLRLARPSPQPRKFPAAPEFSPLPGLTPILTFGSVIARRSEEHTSELQSLAYLVCRLLLEKKKNVVLISYEQLQQVYVYRHAIPH